jgi:hypothetical protein
MRARPCAAGRTPRRATPHADTAPVSRRAPRAGLSFRHARAAAPRARCAAETKLPFFFAPTLTRAPLPRTRAPQQSLYEQFRRVANFYFLSMAGLSLTPFSPVSYVTTWAPLILVIGISMFKEALEDYKRHKQDMEQNNSLVDAFEPGSGARTTVAWRDARPGDVLCVLRDEPFPADLLFLASSNPEGSCYVETKNLDGETNLKLKKALEPTMGMTDGGVGAWRAAVECDAPNNSLYTFMGNLVYKARGRCARARRGAACTRVAARVSVHICVHACARARTHARARQLPSARRRCAAAHQLTRCARHNTHVRTHRSLVLRRR